LDDTVSYLAVAVEHTDWSGRHHIRALDRWVPLHTDEAVAFSERVNGFTVLQSLLGLVGGQARFGCGDDTEKLYCFIPYNQGDDPSEVHTYQDGEVIEGLYVHRLGWPTRVRATGDDVVFQLSDYTGSIELGMDIFQLLYSKQWATSDQCSIAAFGAIDDADARKRGGWIETRPNVGLELFDIVKLSDSWAGGGLSNVKRRVNGIVTEYEPMDNRWLQVVYLEGV